LRAFLASPATAGSFSFLGAWNARRSKLVSLLSLQTQWGAGCGKSCPMGVLRSTKPFFSARLASFWMMLTRWFEEQTIHCSANTNSFGGEYWLS